MTFRSALLLAAASFAALSSVTRAEVALPKVLSSHMVIQRNMPIHIWGTAAPQENVTVKFHSNTGTTTAGADGRWSVYLPPEPAGGPFTLSVQGANTVTLDDILLGDVWIASGQSNMEMPLMGFTNAPIKDSEKVIAAANRPQIRLLFIEKDSQEYPQDDAKAVRGGWSLCTPETAKNFSAAAYFFGLDLQEREKVPIGLIDTSWGGTPAEAWTSLGALSADAGLMGVFSGRAQHMDREGTERRYAELEREAKAAGRPAPPPRAWHPDPASWAPAGLYNAMIAPLTPMAIRGAIWYQGEANRGSPGYAELYSRLFPAMIQDWRRQWGQGDFPFVFVQLSSYSIPGDSGWGLVRDAQRRTLSLAQTGMAVTLDIGEEKNIHPPDKETVGKRLAVAARTISYGEKVDPGGPLFRLAYPVGNEMHVWLDYTKGLNAKGGALRGFELAAADGVFVPATAKIEGETVVVTSPQVASPQFVRYAWASYTDANLYNGAGLPGGTFTSFPVP